MGRKMKTIPNNQVCVACKKNLPSTDFRAEKSHSGNIVLRTKCNSCRRDDRRKLPSSPEINFRNKLKHVYGITYDEYTSMIVKQGNRCAICRIEFADRRSLSAGSLSNSPHIDHCHSTGKVRALLCSDCNRGLGCFKENRQTMFSAIEYLERF